MFRAKKRSLSCQRLLGRMTLLACCGGTVCAAQTALPALPLRLPASVAHDAAGDLFVADALRNQVLEVSLAGVTTVVAGTGEQGFAGDGGPASLALLNAPASVVIAPDGTVYIADTGNQRIRAVVGGQIQTVAGAGVKGYTGDGGSALLAALRNPTALAIDRSGALLIVDSGNHCVRRVASGMIATFAGIAVQGYAGDGGPAASAMLDTPSGIAVATDGRILVADSHNHRLRSIDAAGVITTFAGTGVRGFAGDGGRALSARLFLPQGVALTASGAVIFADSDNHRVRSVDTLGIIRTIAGDGVQGSYADGVAAGADSQDTPRGVAVSSFGAPVASDARNHQVFELAADNAIYTATPAVARASTVSLTGSGPMTYGDESVGVIVSSAAPAVQGSAVVSEAGTVIAIAQLTNGAANVSLGSLPAGQHVLTAAYSGDVLHGAAASSALSLTIAARAIVARASQTTIAYGVPIPLLTGTLSGVLAQDFNNVSAGFAATVRDLSPVGTYPITATLNGSGSGNYSVTMDSSSGALQIAQTASNVSLQTPGTAYAGSPLLLTATVTSTTRGVPTGFVSFLDGGTLVSTARTNNGVATAVYLNPAAGYHALSVAYAGDRNFLASTSAVATVPVSATPDFALAVVGGATQTVQGGALASFSLQVMPQPAPFSGSVSFSVAGLQTGATANFSPPVVVPGNSTVPVTLTIQTVALTSTRGRSTAPVWAFAFVFGTIFCSSKRRRLRAVSCLLVITTLTLLTACGARTVAPHAGNTYAITITATSTNLSGVVVTHVAPGSLIVH